ncbi:MAG: MmcQ/YjbR family DNA-binding protein [Flavobacteriales bacterium]|nr:MmcQ/YjbR family DNA-binding protein [Flavobacteriales bacterium]
MDLEKFREYCLSKPFTTEGFPFDQSTIVFKVMDKMFALTNIDHFESINLKCDPERAILLREEYPQITPGYHMNKKHWNTVMQQDLSTKMLIELIDHSFEMVVNSLPKSKQNEIKKGL